MTEIVVIGRLASGADTGGLNPNTWQDFERLNSTSRQRAHVPIAAFMAAVLHETAYIVIYIGGALMALTSVDLDPQLMERARALTGEKSNRAVLDLALRRLIAAKQKGAMVDGIAELSELPTELGAPVVLPTSTATS